MTTRHADEELEQAACRFDQLADDLDPAVADVDRTDGPRRADAEGSFSFGCDSNRN